MLNILSHIERTERCLAAPLLLAENLAQRYVLSDLLWKAFNASMHTHPPEGDISTHETVHKRRKDVLNRLSRIEGHVRGLRKMVEDDKDCPDILIQVAAVRAALNQVGLILLEDHMENCVLDAAKQGTGEKAIEDLKAAIAKFI